MFTPLARCPRSSLSSDPDARVWNGCRGAGTDAGSRWPDTSGERGGGRAQHGEPRGRSWVLRLTTRRVVPNGRHPAPEGTRRGFGVSVLRRDCGSRLGPSVPGARDVPAGVGRPLGRSGAHRGSCGPQAPRSTSPSEPQGAVMSGAPLTLRSGPGRGGARGWKVHGLGSYP